MSKRKSSRQKLASSSGGRRRQVVIASGVAVSLLVGWTMLAYSGALDSAFRQKGKKSGTVSTQSFNASSPSKEMIYAGGQLLASEEPAGVSGCESPPPTPVNLLATAQSTTSILVTWAASSGADHYELQRRQSIAPGTDWATLSPNPNTDSFTDSPVGANTAYLYRVRAVDASGACTSNYSSVDLATTIIFTDEQLQGQFIKAQHVTQLRQAVDAVRTTANIGAATWTNPLGQVSAVHFSELRTKLNDALPLLGFTQISADSGIAQGQIVYATHLQAVRDKVK